MGKRVWKNNNLQKGYIFISFFFPGNGIKTATKLKLLMIFKNHSFRTGAADTVITADFMYETNSNIAITHLIIEKEKGFSMHSII